MEKSELKSIATRNKIIIIIVIIIVMDMVKRRKE